MSPRAAFTQADVARLLRGAAKAGVAVARIEIDPTGKLVAVFASADDPATIGNEWDEVLVNAKGLAGQLNSLETGPRR